MKEFKGRPYTGAEKNDKTGFFLLWPLAAFPLFMGIATLLTAPSLVFEDLVMTLAAVAFGFGWMCFWGLIPVLAYNAVISRARVMLKSCV